ncbi:AGE family epimerase/isomerase [Paenibacillus hexagrammi]|uniref:Cellobiose 2-epimerase n=1 Tax=Paenibacillus hexagrammi TaxID=2908839 RepID=A0ABY3SHM6_9BACL|nr:AGE family epimerase/isomerase [Paenibacillus sp. YPD9-1]UJF32724.1 AGE family epimerase/isomerase [Paenibacillus sp. YPD9-1]
MTTSHTISQTKSDLLHSMHKEAQQILAFWANHTQDLEHGGFIGAIDSDMTVQSKSPKGLVLNSRILWTFSKGYRLLKNDEYLQIAGRAYEYLSKHFYDSTYGGYYWSVDYQGQPLETRKHIYGQAFTLYALSEYHMACGSAEALERAQKLYAEMEAYCYDSVNKGYFEAFSRNWSLPVAEERLNIYTQDDAKSMNSHLHIMEAYTNLLRAWDFPHLRNKLKELIEVTIDHIVDRPKGAFALYFDEKWQVKSDEISYGHDIEGSWLLDEAAHVLGDEGLISRVKQIALEMAEAVYEHGLDTDGALWNEANGEGEIIDSDKDWWPQAEAVVGFINAYTSSGDEKFVHAAVKAWEFIENTLIDKEHGEWFGKVSKDGIPYADYQKTNAWKCPYHNGRACFEIIERLGHSE